MKKFIYLFLGISLAIIITAFISISSNSVQKSKNRTDSNNQLNDSIPLIVVGSYLNLNENIDLDSLKIKLENGSIFCSKDIAKSLQVQFNLKKEPTSIQLGKFNFKNRSDLLKLLYFCNGI
jgi:uncharacterized alpha/beta hydrolase family protein